MVVVVAARASAGQLLVQRKQRGACLGDLDACVPFVCAGAGSDTKPGDLISAWATRGHGRYQGPVGTLADGTRDVGSHAQPTLRA